jgi:hypothetical protein
MQALFGPLITPASAQAAPNRKFVTRLLSALLPSLHKSATSGPIAAFHRLCGWPAPLTAATPMAPPRCTTSSSCHRLGRGMTSSLRHRPEGCGCFLALPAREGCDCFFHTSPTREVRDCSFFASSEGRDFFLTPPTREGMTSSSSRRCPWRGTTSSTRYRSWRGAASSSSRRWPGRGATSSSCRRPGRARLFPHAVGQGRARLLLPRVTSEGGTHLRIRKNKQIIKHLAYAYLNNSLIKQQLKLVDKLAFQQVSVVPNRAVVE